MKTDSIGGRKFIAYLLTMAGWGAVLFIMVMRGLMDADNSQGMMFYLVLIQGIFFGGNLAEKYILKGGKKNAE